jgi:hypothetical protein
MKRLMWPIFLVLAACLAGAAPAAAQEFQVATADVNQNGFLITVFREIGLSPGTQVVYTYQADVTATYGCLPNGYSVNKKKVPDIPKETVSEVGVTRWETLDVGNKGKVVDGMAIDPPEPPSTLVASCNAGTIHLVMVTYSNVQLWSSNNGVTTKADLSGSCAPGPDGTGTCSDVLLPGR